MSSSRLFLLSLSLCLAACTRNADDQRIVLGFSQIGAESAWRRANTESIRSAAATSNIDLRFADAEQKQANQIAAIRGFIADKVDVIAFAPVVTTGWEPVLGKRRRGPRCPNRRAVREDNLVCRFLVGLCRGRPQGGARILAGNP